MPIRSHESVIGARAFLIGIIIALAVGVFTGNRTSPWIFAILAFLGIIVGFFVAEKDSKTFLLASVSVVIVSFAGIQGLILDAAIRGIDIGKILSSILGTFLFLFVPATIVVAIKTVFAISKQ